MNDTVTQSPVEPVPGPPNSDPPRVQPMPKGFRMGAILVVLGVAAAGVWIFLGPPVGSKGGGTQPMSDARFEVFADETSAPSEWGVPEPTDAAWMEDALDTLNQRLERLETEIQHLQRRHGVLATELDTFMADPPWQRDAPDVARINDALQAQQEQWAHLEEQWGALTQRVDDLALAQRTLVAQRNQARSLPPRPPFSVVAIDWWNGEPYALLAHEGAYARLPVGERLGGWQLEALEPVARRAVFERSGHRVTLRVEEG